MLKLLTTLAGFFGVSTTPIIFVFGLSSGLIAGGLATAASYKFGHYIGYNSGVDDATKQAEINALNSKLADAAVDLQAANKASEDALNSAESSRQAAEAAQKEVDDYAKELAARPAPKECSNQCGATAADVKQLHPGSSIAPVSGRKASAKATTSGK